MRITHFFIHRPISAMAIVLVLLVLGVYGYQYIPVDFLPGITYPMVKVHIWWRGATPEEIDKSIADPLERQMAQVENLDYLDSSSIEGMYTLLVNFRYGTNVDVAYQDALAAMQRAARQLPTDMDPPVIIKADPSQLPVLQLTIKSATWDLVQLRTWAENWLQDQILVAPGVAGTEIVGGLRREIRVHLDAESLEKYRLSLSDVHKRLQNENVEQFGGRVTTGRKEVIARTMGEFKSLDEIRDILVSREGSKKVHLRDLATVEDAHEEERVITRLDSEPCVKLSVLKQSDANTVEVARAVEKRLLELKASLPPEIEIGVVENQADYVNAALNGVKTTAWQAAVLVMLIVWLFLGSLRQVAVVAVSLPLTLVLNFGLMKLGGFSLNIFSLGGLVVAIGVLVDNSIVVVETITRRMGAKANSSIKQVALDSALEVGPSILAATLSFLALFMPFLMVPGLVSLLFKELILVIAGIVVLSFVTALTITPLIASALMGVPSNEDGLFQRFFLQVSAIYESLLRRFLLHGTKVLGIFVLILVFAVFSFKRLGSEFLPMMDDGRVMIKVKLATGASLQETNRVLALIEEVLGNDPLIQSRFTLAGGKVWGLYTYEIANEGQVDIQLVPKARRNISTMDFVKRLRPLLGKIPVPGGKIMAMQAPIKGIRKIGNAEVELKIRGSNLDNLFKIAQKTVKTMNEMPQFTNVVLSMDLTKPEYQILVDRKRAADLNLSLVEISTAIRSLITGTVATRFRDGDEYYNIRVMIPEERFKSSQDVENLILKTAAGGYLRLKDVAKVIEAVGPVEIVRENQIKQVIIQADTQNVSLGEAVEALKSRLDSGLLQSGYEFSFGGQAQMMNDMIKTVTAILLFSMFFAFIVLTVQFNNLRYSSLILLSVPFCLSGFVLLLLLTGVPMGATVLIGVLIIVSATINDGVLLLTYADELREAEGLNAFDAVLKAASIRLRPRVMTTVSTLVGFIPIALAMQEGGDMLMPMAMAAIGGLLMEMLVALFLMPCLYLLLSSQASLPKESL